MLKMRIRQYDVMRAWKSFVRFINININIQCEESGFEYLPFIDSEDSVNMRVVFGIANSILGGFVFIF
jgi:hypothetical protein